MLTAMDKGIKAAEVATPPVGVHGGVDLRILPKFITFKAAMLKSQMTQQFVIAVGVGLLVSSFAISRFEIAKLETKLREKEYILAPGVLDFTTASAQSVPDRYPIDAAMTFAHWLGDVNATNIDEQFSRLMKFMSPSLRVQFESESREWRDTVKSENISEIVRITDHQVKGTEDGRYQAVLLSTRERYANGESLGRADETITISMQLVPPERGKEWFLQITSLKRQNAQAQNQSAYPAKTQSMKESSR